jgi:sulfur carrier protein
MNIFVNNEIKVLSVPLRLSELLSDINLSSARGIAIAINNEVIPKAIWENHLLKENDKVTIIRATQGG